MTLNPNVDNNETITVSWNNALHLDEERYMVTAASDSGSAYTSTLTISTLVYQDAGKYICTGKITGENGLKVTGSANHDIDTIRKAYLT